MSKQQLYRLLLALAGSLGVGMQLYEDGWGMLLYYTVLSNLLVIASLYYLIYRESKGTHLCPQLLRVKGGVSMAIAITFVIYNVLLAPRAEPEDFWTLRNFLVHYLVPIGFLIDGLVLDTKNLYKRFDPWLWTLTPLIYCFFALFNGLVLKLPVPGSKDSPFPYFFLNVHTQGVQGVLITSSVIFLAYLLAGYLWLLAKRFIGKTPSTPQTT